MFVQTLAFVVASVNTNTSPEVEFIQRCPTEAPAIFSLYVGSDALTVASSNPASVVDSAENVLSPRRYVVASLVPVADSFARVTFASAIFAVVTEPSAISAD
jgi:hypothetical protein